MGNNNFNYAYSSSEDLSLLRHLFSCHCFLSSVENVLLRLILLIQAWICGSHFCVISSHAPHKNESKVCSRNEIKMMKLSMGMGSSFCLKAELKDVLKKKSIQTYHFVFLCKVSIC